MEKKKKLTMNLTLLILGLVPLLIGVIVSSIMSYMSLKNELIEQTQSKLSLAASSVANYYGVDWTTWMENGIGEGDETFIDGGQADGIEQTVFRADPYGKVVRYLSSIKDAAGNRASGTTAADEITAQVYGAGKTYYGDGVAINGKDYYVCYKPLKDENGKIVGMAFAGEADTKLNSALNSLLLKTLAVSALITILCVIIVIYVAVKIVRTIKGLTDVTVRLSEGYINDEITVSSPIRELSDIIGAASVLQENLQMIVENIRQTSGDLSVSVTDTNGLCSSSAEGSTQISSAVAELATASQTMAEAVQALNENILEIGNRINAIDESVGTLSAASDTMNVISNEAKDNINAVYYSSEKSVNDVNNIADHMEELSRAIGEVSDATKLISDISSQTNLLSLNASIEAARAGEAGRGFAVVASEISSLASQSDEGVKRIDEVVRKVLDLSNMSMQLTNEIKSAISDEQKMVKSTQDSFLKLKAEIDESINQISNIANDTAVLAQAKDSAVGSVSDLSAISEENAASTQEVTASIENLSTNINDISVRSDDMQNMSVTLVDAIAAFKED